LLDIIDRLSTQKKQSRQAAVAYMLDIRNSKRLSAKPTRDSVICYRSIFRSWKYSGGRKSFK
ncbi:hypothetical protein, partial [Acetobacter malorum]|uniref:hypothetical protein n=1 Tax=Acetobacter malorum TaxID=178901 RepID=UPI001C4F06E6